jgi:hypothetical protein
MTCARTDETAGIMLLEDIQRIFADRAVDRLLSAEMVDALSKMEDRPWPEWHRGKPITPRQIAKLLGPFGVTPKTVRTNGTAKGYKLDDFKDAFERYLTVRSVTPSQINENKGFTPERAVTSANVVTDQIEQKVNESKRCDGVTAKDAEQALQTDGMPDLPQCLRRRRVTL